jgi:hypothetical protein
MGFIPNATNLSAGIQRPEGKKPAQRFVPSTAAKEEPQVPDESLPEIVGRKPEPPGWAPIYPRLAATGQTEAGGGDVSLGQIMASLGLDIASLPFRSIATGAGTLGELSGSAATGEGIEPGKKVDYPRLAESYLRRLGQTGGTGEYGTVNKVAEEIARDPANVLAFAKPVQALGWASLLPEALASAGIHQAEHTARGEEMKPLEAAPEVALGFLPAFAEIMRQGGASTMRAQIPAQFRKQTGDIADIMDIMTSKKAPSELGDVIDVQRKIATARPQQIWSATSKTQVPANLDELVNTSKLVDTNPSMMKQIVRKGGELWDSITKGWTKKGMATALQSKMDDFEKSKRALINMADEYATKRGTGTSFDELIDQVRQELAADPKLAPMRDRVEAELNRAIENLRPEYAGVAEAGGALLPSQVDQLKRVAGAEGKWIKRASETGDLVTALDPNASAREKVYNSLYGAAKRDIENKVGGNLIKEYNDFEHEIMPFLKGLEKSEVENIGVFGRIVPMISGGVGGLGYMIGSMGKGGVAGGLKGTLAAIPAWALATYGRSAAFPRTMYGVGDVLQAVNPNIPVVRQALRTATQEPAAGETREEAMQRRMKQIFEGE